MAGGGLGFGAGFAQGLANSFRESRQRNIERGDRDADMAMRAFLALKDDPNVRDYNDLAPFLEAGMGGQNSGFFGKRKKGAPDIHAILKEIIGPHLGKGESGADATSIARGSSTGTNVAMNARPAVKAPPAQAMATARKAVTPTGSAVTPPSFLDTPQQKDNAAVSDLAQPDFLALGAGTPPTDGVGGGVDTTGLFGQPAVEDAAAAVPAGGQPQRRGLFMSRNERTDTELATQARVLEGNINTKMSLAEKILPHLQALDPQATLDDALRVVGVQVPRDYRTSSAAAQSVAGEVPDGKGGWEPAFAIFDRQNQVYLDPDTHEPLDGFRPRMSTTAGTQNRSLGADREALSREMYGKPAKDLTPEQMAAVNTALPEFQRKMSAGRALGTGQGQFNAPISVDTAQTTGTQVGASSANYAGQIAPKTEDIARRRSVEELKTSLVDIRDNLITGVLPNDADTIGGVVPGAVYAVQRRDPKYRAKIARLESRINNIVNVMARSVGEQRGTQTERDAARAEAAIASIHDAVFTGDTVESSTARIGESLKILDEILAKLPATPVPVATPSRSTTPITRAGQPETAPQKRLRAREVLQNNQFAADDAAITTFLQNNPNF